MARFSRKIEDVLASVSVPMSASPQIIGKYDDDPPRETVSFPKILDFSFPQSSPDSKITQVGEVIYVGDGVCHVAGLDNPLSTKPSKSKPNVASKPPSF
jgi:hypothetical protein